MTNASSVRSIRSLVLAVLVFAPASWTQQRPPMFEKMAKTFGCDSWNQIEAIRYTWNFQLGKLSASRTWEWEPKTGKVTYASKDKDGKPVNATYMTSELSSQSDDVKNNIQPAFVNDNYTFLFPLHASWDASASVTDQGMFNLPVGGGSAELIAVKYPAEGGGYTPGDTWQFYVGKDGRAEYWVYQRGGGQETEYATHDMGRREKGRSSAGLNGSSRDGGRPADTYLLYGCGRQADGIRQVAERAVS